MSDLLLQLESAQHMHKLDNYFKRIIQLNRVLVLDEFGYIKLNEAQAFVQQVYKMLPHIKITDLLLEVDEWTEFSKSFTHLKSGDIPKDRILLLSTILANGINLGLTKMAESLHGTTYTKLARLQAWYIRDETYSDALA